MSAEDQTNKPKPDIPEMSPTGWPNVYGIPSDDYLRLHTHQAYDEGSTSANLGITRLSEYERMERDRELLKTINGLKDKPLIGEKAPEWDNRLLIPSGLDREALRAARAEAIGFIAKTLSSFRRDGVLIISGQRFHFPSMWLRDVVPTKIEGRLQRAHAEQSQIGRRNSIEVVLTDALFAAEPKGRELYTTKIEVAYHGQYDSYGEMRRRLVPSIRGARPHTQEKPIEIKGRRNALITDYLPPLRKTEQTKGSRYAAIKETSYLFRTLRPDDPRALQATMREWTHYHTYPSEGDYRDPIRHTLPHYFLEPDNVTAGSINRVLRMVEAMSWAVRHTDEYREFLRLPNPEEQITPDTTTNK